MYQDFSATSFPAYSTTTRTAGRPPATDPTTTTVDAVTSKIEAFSDLMARADRDADGRGGSVSDAVASEIHDACNALARMLDEYAGDGSGLSEDERKDFGIRIRKELMPHLNRSQLSDRIYSKPRGYAGDYLTIAIMYEDTAAGAGHAGRIFDRAIRDQPACTAVINRRGILAEEIARTCTESGAAVTRVTSLASGPAAELFDVFDSIDDPDSLVATCVDIDDQALDYVADRSEERGIRDRVVLHQGNLVYLAAGRRTLDMPPQDLIYSIGLIDYFDDKFVVRLLDYVHSLLKPGGRAIFGNFHVDNPSKALMDHVLDWQLIHRTEADMHRLFRTSKFGRECTNIRFEDEGVNMFAECIKAQA